MTGQPRPGPIGRRLFRAAVASSAAITVFHFVWLWLKLGGEFATTAFTDILGVPAALSATVACFAAARTDRTRARRAWVALGAGTGFWAIGEVIWTYHEVVLRDEVPFPGWADVGFLGLVPLGVAAMLAFPTAPRSAAARMRAILDGLIIGGSLLFLAWATFLGPAYAAAEGGLLMQVVGLAYPLGDVVMIAIVLYVMARAGRRERVALGLVALGLISISAADAGFTYLAVNEMYSAGSLIDPLWNLGFFLIALAALRRPHFDQDVADDRKIGPVAITAPYIPFALAVGAAMVVQVTRGALEPFLFWDAIVVIACLVTRQVLALFDNHSLNRDLERRVADRTADLERALVEVEKSKRLQEEFIANTSHELLTPLTAILASTEILDLEADDLTEHGGKSLAIARRSAVHMKRLVENVLLASGIRERIACGRDRLVVRDEIEGTIRSAKLSPDRGVRVDVSSELEAVGDRSRFREVIDHLLENAEKFSPPGTSIHVEAWRAEDATVHVTVRDEGPGIPESERETVFARFHQIDGSATRRHGGLGLGLYLARHVMEAMDGSLTVDRSPVGAQLHLTLPGADVAEPSSDSPTGVRGAA